MKAYETHPGMYHFKYLPAFAQYILDNHLDEFVRDQITLFFELNLPIMRLFTHLSEDQIFEISKKNNTELLAVLAENKAKEFIEFSLEKWANDQHEMVGKFDVGAEDITLVNYIRHKALRKWIWEYTSTQEETIALIDEVADYTFANNTSGTNTYIQILTERIEKKSEQLFEAQSIAQIGGFEWDFINVSRGNSPELRKIFETEKPQSFEEMIEKIHPADRDRLMKAIKVSLVEGNLNVEYRYIINNKEKVLWTRGIIHYKDGKPALMTGTVQDISGRKNIEHNLVQKTLELELSNSNLEKFAYVASHDLQEPLRKILMHTDLLLHTEKERLSERGKTLFDKIVSSTSKMKRLIIDILAYSTIHPGKEKEKVNLQDLVNEVKIELEYMIKKNKATIIADDLPEAYVFPSQIKQLFQNLISNSIKFSKKSVAPIVTISHQIIQSKQVSDAGLAPANKYHKFEVTDNGIGFSADHSQDIFLLFKRLHSQKDFEGSGLGLSICKKVVENHGGSIEAVGNGNDGAKFIIILPHL